MKARVQKRKVRTMGKDQQERLKDVMEMLFSNSARHMPIHETISRYVTYQKHFKKMVEIVVRMSQILKDYDTNLSEFTTDLIGEFGRHFSINPTDSNITQDQFYDIYENFKSSDFLEWPSRIALKIKQSEIIHKKETYLNANNEKRTKTVLKEFDSVCVDCQNGMVAANFLLGVGKKDVLFDFSKVFHSGFDIPKNSKISIYGWIKQLHKIGKKVYKLAIQPDIPIDEIFNELLNGLEGYKVKIRGADKLFNLLRRKSELFKNNFTKYYKDMKQAQNPIEIFRSFLSDVIKDKDIQDPKLLLQCKKLIAEIRKSFASIPMAKQTQEFAKVNSLIDGINSFIDRYEDISNKPEDDGNIEELTKMFEEKFLSM